MTITELEIKETYAEPELKKQVYEYRALNGNRVVEEAKSILDFVKMLREKNLFSAIITEEVKEGNWRLKCYWDKHTFAYIEVL